jgi:hypothetical protein
MRLVSLLFILATFTADALAYQPSDDGRNTNEQWHLGYELFQMLMEERGLTPERSWDDALSSPSTSVVVVCGDLRQIPQRDWLRARRFVDQGGAMLVASEGGFDFPGVCSFYQGTVVTGDSRDRYQSFADCIRIRKLKTDDALVKGVGELVVNRTGWLSVPTDDSMDWQIIASLPSTTLPRASRSQPLILAGRGAEPLAGVMVLAADESLFTNGMLWHGDNAVLAIQVSELLCSSKRRSLLFVRNGIPLLGYRESSAVQNQPPEQPPVPQPPLPPVNIQPPEPDFDTKLKLANAVINEVQESNLINEVLRDRPRQARPLAYLKTVLLILLVLATLFILWRLMQSPQRLPPEPGNRFMQSVFGVMTARQMANSEFGAAIVLLARDLCIELTGSRIETDWIRCLSERQGSPARNLNMAQRRELTEILGLAVRGATIHIPRRRFQSLGRSIKELRDVHRATPIVEPVS